MFQKFKRMCRKAKKTIMQVSTKVRMLIIALLGGIPASCHGQTLLCHCWCRGHHRSHFGVYRHEQRGTGCQEEDHDGSWGVPFSDCGGPSITSILRN